MTSLGLRIKMKWLMLMTISVTIWRAQVPKRPEPRPEYRIPVMIKEMFWWDDVKRHSWIYR
jgi:hypothetical protein